MTYGMKESEDIGILSLMQTRSSITCTRRSTSESLYCGEEVWEQSLLCSSPFSTINKLATINAQEAF